MSVQYSYVIHDIITVQSEVGLPELEPFLVAEPILEPDIQVSIGMPARKPHSQTDPHTRHLYYQEAFKILGFEAEIEIGEKVKVTASPLLRYSPHVLYTNLVEPILRWSFVERGYALVHGATIAFGNAAYMITARTDTGKTTTLLKILNHQRRDTDTAAFISDDLTLISPDGIAMTYPKPLTISHHTVQAVNSAVLTRKERLALLLQSRVHSRSGRRFAFSLAKLNSLPTATINMFVQMVVPPPKYQVTRLVPKVKLVRKAKLTGLFIIEVGATMDRLLEPKEAMEILLANCEDAFGFPPYHSIKEFLYNSNGNDLRPVEQDIVRQAFQGIPTMLIRNNTLEWWRRIPVFVGDEVAAYFTERPQPIPGSFRDPAHVHV
ncbi:MAG: hypothetical protein M1281_10600 [Chloroflexi bacterium]|nr:hypothetical protein [Chloroflexota bacterium]